MGKPGHVINFRIGPKIAFRHHFSKNPTRAEETFASVGQLRITDVGGHTNGTFLIVRHGAIPRFPQTRSTPDPQRKFWDTRASPEIRSAEKKNRSKKRIRPAAGVRLCSTDGTLHRMCHPPGRGRASLHQAGDKLSTVFARGTCNQVSARATGKGTNTSTGIRSIFHI